MTVDAQSLLFVQALMGGLLFGVGIICILSGLAFMLTRHSMSAVHDLSVHSADLGQKALGDTTLAPVMESASHLISAITQLIRTAVGVGIFLCLLGLSMCLAGYFIVARIA